jgi:hypothetical protein
MTPGLHYDIPDAAYQVRRRGLLRKSNIPHIRRTGAHYLAHLAEEDKETDAKRLGRALHCAAFEPSRHLREYAVLPDFGDLRKAANKAARTDWINDSEGLVVLKEAEADTVAHMVAALRAHPLARPLLAGGHPEVSAYWTDPETGVDCAARADYWIPDRRILVDLKSAEDASREGFAKAIGKYGYHLQESHYRSGWEALGETVEHFLFVAVEKTPPYGVAVYPLGRAGVARADLQVRDALAKMAECVRTDEWPCYPLTIEPVDVPPWA